MLRTPDGGQKPPAGKRQDGKGPEEKEKKGIVRSIYVKISLDKLYKILYNLNGGEKHGLCYTHFRGKEQAV